MFSPPFIILTARDHGFYGPHTNGQENRNRKPDHGILPPVSKVGGISIDCLSVTGADINVSGCDHADGDKATYRMRKQYRCLGMGERVSSGNSQHGTAAEHPVEPKKKTERRISPVGGSHATPPVNYSFTG
jgi:hypothetical protein